MKVAAAVLACVCAIAVSAFAQAGPPATVSDQDEIRIGKVLADKFAKEEGLAPTPQIVKIEAYLQAVGDKLAAHAARKLPYRFHFDPDPSFKSAFALPGGEIFVGGGVLAMMDSEDELAVVLGHEMKHADLNQCRDRLIQELAKEKLTIAALTKSRSNHSCPAMVTTAKCLPTGRVGNWQPRPATLRKPQFRLLSMYVALGQQLPGNPSEAESRLKERIAAFQALIKGEKLATPKEKPLALPQQF